MAHAALHCDAWKITLEAAGDRVVFPPVADLGFFKGRGHSGATIYRGGPSIMQFF